MRRAKRLIPVETTEIVAVLVLNDNAVHNRHFRALLRLRVTLDGGEG